MPINFRWLDADESILIVHSTDDWKFEEFLSVDQQCKALLRSKPHRVDSLVDVRGTFLNTTRIFLTANETIRDTPPNLEMMLIIGLSAMLRAFVMAGLNAHPEVKLRIAFARSESEALEILTADRELRGRMNVRTGR